MNTGHTEILYILLIFHLSSSEGVRCYICDSVAHLEDCAHVGVCGSHQQCYTQRIIGQRHNYFRVGCTDSNVCSQSQASGVGSIGVGKRSVMRRDNGSQADCLQCCTRDYCNRALCGAVKTSNRRCYDCSDVTDPGDCDKVVECGRDEQCFVHYGPLQPNLRYAYSLKCMSNLVCQTLTHALVHLGTGCTKCCNNTDYCNRQVCNSLTKSTTALPVTKIQSVSNPRVVTTHHTPPQTAPPKPVITGTTSALYSLDVNLQCSGPGSVLSTHWYFNQNDPLPPEAVASGGALHISSLNETTAGRYTCMTVSQGGAIYMASVMVTILDTPPIVISVTKSPPVISIGHSFRIHCNAVGYPVPRIQWQFLGLDGSSTVPGLVRYSSDLKTLEVTHYSRIHHDGRWTCRASNYLGVSQASVNVL